MLTCRWECPKCHTYNISYANDCDNENQQCNSCKAEWDVRVEVYVEDVSAIEPHKGSADE